ncbi:YceI family protein [Algoriphagus sp. H41]|uniref:YceI family protein n=1 Tax=Algoriphagus oliviformis TaxID=2811231 RepID=A0ABS3C3L0_9BACT|nr:YceI family protein [Algoriphagus oliviformis]MBN7811547.1 YceI family protein [Algoriphagus oliviformis]
MKFISTIALAVGTFLASATAPIAPATVNKTESTVKWMAEKVTGKHWGYVPISDAQLDVANGKITGGTFEMDMVNLTVEDLTDPKSKGNLTNHLKSDDFFSVEKFNKATLKIKDAKTSNGTDYTISGDLTIKGVTQPVSFPAKVSVAGKQLTATGEITFDRTKYDIKYRSSNYFENLADKAIYDDVKLEVKLVATI